MLSVSNTTSPNSHSSSVPGDILPRHSDHIPPRAQHFPTVDSNALEPAARTLGPAYHNDTPSCLASELCATSLGILQYLTGHVVILQPTSSCPQPDKACSVSRAPGKLRTSSRTIGRVVTASKKHGENGAQSSKTDRTSSCYLHISRASSCTSKRVWRG